MVTDCNPGTCAPGFYPGHMIADNVALNSPPRLDRLVIGTVTGRDFREVFVDVLDRHRIFDYDVGEHQVVFDASPAAHVLHMPHGHIFPVGDINTLWRVFDGQILAFEGGERLRVEHLFLEALDYDDAGAVGLDVFRVIGGHILVDLARVVDLLTYAGDRITLDDHKPFRGYATLLRAPDLLGRVVPGKIQRVSIVYAV